MTRATRLPTIREHTGDVVQERIQREQRAAVAKLNKLLSQGEDLEGRSEELAASLAATSASIDAQIAALTLRVATLESAGWGPFGRVGHLTLPMGNANVTLTAEQAKNYMIAATGAHTAIRTLTFPAPLTESATYMRLVWNFTTGGFAVRCSIGSGTTFDVTSGAPRYLVFLTTGVFQVP